MRKIGQVLSSVLLAVLIIACLLLVAPRAFGIQLFSVLSGSMEPSFHVNDLVYAFPTAYEDIQAGDPITFKLNENTVVTHRVVLKDDATQSLYTKGDANETADGMPTAYSDVIGVVRFYIPKVGGVLQSVSSGSGRIIVLTVAAVVILLTLLLSINGQPENDDEQKTQKKRRPQRTAQAARRKASPPDDEWDADDDFEPPNRHRAQTQVTPASSDEWDDLEPQEKPERRQRTGKQSRAQLPPAWR